MVSFSYGKSRVTIVVSVSYDDCAVTFGICYGECPVTCGICYMVSAQSRVVSASYGECPVTCGIC